MASTSVGLVHAGPPDAKVGSRSRPDAPVVVHPARRAAALTSSAPPGHEERHPQCPRHCLGDARRQAHGIGDPTPWPHLHVPESSAHQKETCRPLTCPGTQFGGWGHKPVPPEVFPLATQHGDQGHSQDCLGVNGELAGRQLHVLITLRQDAL